MMFETLLVGIDTYIITAFLGYVVHWAIHQPWSGTAHEAHRRHHVELYPPGDLISDKYRSAGAKSTVWTFLALFSPVVVAPFVAWAMGKLTFTQAITIVATMALVGLANDSIHDSFHVRDHWMSRVIPGYHKMRERHFIHHVNMKKNFGIYSFTSDKIFGTYKE